MGCDIHLYVEYRLKEARKRIVREAEYDENGNKTKDELSYMEEKKWHSYQFGKQWSDRIYGMFAILADVRNYGDKAHIELRGFPDDATQIVKNKYYLIIVPDEVYKRVDYRCCSESNATRWGGERFTISGREYTKHPDYHSANWCTTEEMREAIESLFKKEDGTYKGDYIEWLGLIGTMEGIESSGEYECRAVFWFDN